MIPWRQNDWERKGHPFYQTKTLETSDVLYYYYYYGRGIPHNQMTTTSRSSSGKPYMYVVEHLDPELGPWSALEYQAIAAESREDAAVFCLSSVPEDLVLPHALQAIPGLIIEHRSVETVYATSKERVCLLDPAAPKELAPDDAAEFDIFLFGGILGTHSTLTN